MSNSIRCLPSSLLVVSVVATLFAQSLEPTIANDELSLADRAVIAKYRVARLLRDKYLAEATIKNSDKTIKAGPARIKKEQAVLAKAKLAYVAANKVLATATATLESAKEKAKSTDDATLKAAVTTATRAQSQAKQEASRKKYAFDRATSKLKSETDRVEKAKLDKIAAQKSIPEKQAAADKVKLEYESLRKQSIEMERDLVAKQQPQIISARIDQVIDRRLTEEKITASEQIQDGKFLRRVTLDIAGRIPTYQEVVEFLASSDKNKREAAVNRLLASEDYGRTFGTIFADLTTHRPTTTATRTKDHFREWLIESLNLNRTWDDITTDMLASEGDTGSNPGSIYLVAYRLNNQPDPPAIFASAGEMFMGLQIKCAQCHDHPFVEGWSQDDFWAMTAMFSRVRLKGSSIYRALEYELTDKDVAEKELFRAGGGVKYPPPLPSGQIAIPDPTDETKTLKTISAKLLDGTTPQLPEKGFYRKDFARWLTATDNPYFAKAMVNRLWGHFFARGLVQPIAHMNPDNEPTHPEVLTALEQELKGSGYDLKHLIRCIVLTQAYQRSSRPNASNINDAELYSHMLVKTLEADALFDSLTVAIGRPRMSDNRRQTYKDLFDTRLPEVDPGKFTHSIPQVLRMMNAREYNDASTTIAAATNGKETDEAVNGLFLAALARQPTDSESKRMMQFIAQHTETDKRKAYADVFWVLINSAEFLVNH